MSRVVPIDEDAKRRVLAAVEAVERRSSAEVVIAVRRAAGGYRHVEYLLGAALAYAMLLVTLFAPPIFELPMIALLVLLSFTCGVAIARVTSALTLRLAGRERVAQRVREAARAAFVECGVSATRERTGILVYVALLERRCVLVPDIGVTSRIPRDAWEATRRAIEGVPISRLFKGAAPEALARALEGAIETLAEHLPRRADDVDELPALAEEVA